MKKTPNQSSKYLLWPLAILIFLTVAVLFTSKEIPKQQEIRSRAQVDQSTQSYPIINLSFAVPGIGTQAGNLKPLHPVRPVTIRFYNPDTNTFDKAVKPLYEAKTLAVFDGDSTSPNYGTFQTSNFHLGTTVPAGKYQIAFKTDQAVQQLIRDNPANLAGHIFEVSDKTIITLPLQNLIVGDIAPLPDGDNLVDEVDYAALTSCFGTRINDSNCPSKDFADLDDNGVVDGVDYNLMLLGHKHLTDLGFFDIRTSKTPVQNLKTTPVVTKAPSTKPITTQNPSSGMGIFITIIIFILILSAGIYWFKKVRGAGGKEYYIKKKLDESTVDSGQGGVWLTLVDDAGQTLGHYNKTDVKDGFARIKGKTKTEDGKTFIEISEIIWEK